MKRAVALFGRTFRALRPHRRLVWIGLAAVIAEALLALAMPVAASRAVDFAVDLAGTEAVDASARFLWICALVLALGIGGAGLRYVGRRRLIEASRLVEEQLKNDLVAHLQRLPLAWFDKARTGDLISRLTQDIELLRFVVGPMLLQGGASLVIVPGGFVIMALLSWKLCVIALAALGGLLATLTFVMPRLERRGRRVQESIGRISQRCAEDFAGIRVVLGFGRARAEAKWMADLSEDYLTHNVALGRIRAVMNLLIHGGQEVVILGVLLLGAHEAMAGRVTPGQIFLFLTLSGVMVWPLIATSWVLATVHRAFAAAERIEEVFAVRPESREGASPTLRGRVVIRNLTFSYPGQERPALQDVTLVVEAGQTLGLAGPIGSGKSTLLALLLRLYDPPPGTVFVDGFDVLELQPSALRAAFALAPQDPFLFSDTIRGNVAFGEASATRESTAHAVHQSALEQDLDAFPEGLESVVGERGLTLSGGQKQRVSLARALAANRAALVLDDTLSAVDHTTEATILKRLALARAGRTTLIAAHRLSAIIDAQLIVVLDRGQVIERGTHQELLAHGGWYARAFAKQSEANALEEADEPS